MPVDTPQRTFAPRGGRRPSTSAAASEGVAASPSPRNSHNTDTERRIRLPGTCPHPSHDIEASPTFIPGSLSRADREVDSQTTLDELGKKKRVTPSLMTDVTPGPAGLFEAHFRRKRQGDGIRKQDIHL